MKYLFIHNRFPAQFFHIIKYLSNLKNDIVYVSQYKRPDIELKNVKNILIKNTTNQQKKYKSESDKVVQEFFLTGELYASVLMKLKSEGFYPDVIYAHPGWGGAIYVPDIFPESIYIMYCEWFYTKNELYNFFSKKDKKPAEFAVYRQRNLYQLDALRECDFAFTPTFYQASQYPIEYTEKINVLHDGIDMDFFAPKDKFEDENIIQGLDISCFSEIVTYTARGLEPYRGFPQFFESIPYILKSRPKCHVIIMANDDVSYTKKREDGKTWKEFMCETVKYDTNRVHFLDYGEYKDYVKLLQASTVHVYLTVPFVLSWSLLEAMSCGCLVIASDTSPVQEVIKNMYNGILTSFYDSQKIAKTVVLALSKNKKYETLRVNARKTIREKYDVRKTLQTYMSIFNKKIK